MRTRTIAINRAPVLTCWAAVVAERLGFDWEEAGGQDAVTPTPLPGWPVLSWPCGSGR